MAISLQLRRQFPINLKNPNITTTTIHLFSSSPNTNPNEEDSPQSESPSPMSNYFSTLKSSLKNPSQSPPRKQPPFLSPDNASLQQVRKNLSQYRILNTASPTENPQSPSSSSPQSKPISFQDIYQRRNQEDANNKPVGFDNIRDTLKKLNIKGSINGNRTPTKKDMFSLKDLRGDFATKPSGIPKSSVVAGVQIVQPPPQRPNLNFSFGEKTRGGSGSGEKSSSEGVVKNELIKIYRYEELGEKLRRLRPANAKPGQNWFSLSELNERLIKLREIDERESSQNIRGLNFSDVRESIQQMQSSDKDATERRNKSTIQLQNLSFLANLGGTPSYMLSPPKEELVEKYFHPDNMSSADKLKLELKKIRDEFKMSESDCGSSRVQVAQLTVKIKHLSSALHKKDKHSRKGLQEMVVRRKKLLKYLRRTDWDSYCFCLSKLGLRDNTDVSHTERERVRKKARERRSA